MVVNFNPRSPHGERQRLHRRERRLLLISIHAPRTGSDDITGERLVSEEFQSTLPARGATGTTAPTATYGQFQSTLPARGATHPLRHHHIAVLFQSTLPARGATMMHPRRSAKVKISIHAPRTGSDRAAVADKSGAEHFNPRSPHGERPFALIHVHTSKTHFNPRSPHGERPKK